MELSVGSIRFPLRGRVDIPGSVTYCESPWVYTQRYEVENSKKNADHII